MGVWSSETISEIRILDVLGNEIYREQNLASTNIKFQMPNLAKGIYFLKVTVNGKSGMRKFMKE
jgi:hypothetical protein